jgi:hypothetical protein
VSSPNLIFNPCGAGSLQGWSRSTPDADWFYGGPLDLPPDAPAMFRIDAGAEHKLASDPINLPPNALAAGQLYYYAVLSETDNMEDWFDPTDSIAFYDCDLGGSRGTKLSQSTWHMGSYFVGVEGWQLCWGRISLESYTTRVLMEVDGAYNTGTSSGYQYITQCSLWVSIEDAPQGDILLLNGGASVCFAPEVTANLRCRDFVPTKYKLRNDEDAEWGEWLPYSEDDVPWLLGDWPGAHTVHVRYSGAPYSGPGD